MSKRTFICKCKKSEGEISNGKVVSIPCPSCNRLYKGVYNPHTQDVEVREIIKDKW